MKKIIVTLALLASAVLPMAAQAAPPTILSVSQADGHATVTWSNPVGTTDYSVIEIATAQTDLTTVPGQRNVGPVQTGSDGSYFTENVATFALSTPMATTWTDTNQLAPGYYYVHVGGNDTLCDACPYREWSATVALTVPSPVVASTITATLSHACAHRVRISASVTPTSSGKFRYVIGGNGYRKSVTTASTYVTSAKLKPGRYTLTVQYSGFVGSTSDGTTTYTPSNVVVRHFTVKKNGC